MNKDDLEYLRDVLVNDHQALTEEPVGAEEIDAACATFTLQAEVETLAAREAASSL
ncbi:MAG: hypothetical protein NXI12_14725 [Alphaproteobacteria bacterium]|nr:hypothetical protein [Alphaproteobacteria bacterium]